jgi:hypothetical protein
VKPFGRKVEFAFCRSLRFLLEGVQDHDAVRKPCQIDDPERARAIANPDFANAPAYRLHWPPVIRLKTALDAVKLVASGPPRADGKLPKPSKGVTGEFYRFQRRFLYRN